MPGRTTSEKKYKIHSIFHTLQGEGIHSGRSALFVRFSGCNVWSGLEKDRERGLSPCARICDTRFHGTNEAHGGGFYTADGVLQKLFEMQRKWTHLMRPLVVLTGGEPSLQLDQHFVDVVGAEFLLTVETNGSKQLPNGLHSVCLSPKPPVQVVDQRYDEIKVLFPLYDPNDFLRYPGMRWIQPVDDENLRDNMRQAVEYCMANPHWRLSIQAHKVWGIE